MHMRPIASTGELLPVIGCGTYVGFDVSTYSGEYQRLPAVLDALFDAGGSVIDSSPMYGHAEAVLGQLLAKVKPRAKPLLATKVWTTGRDQGIHQMERSLTCAIPGTGDPAHMADNAQAGSGQLPDDAFLEKIAECLNA